MQNTLPAHGPFHTPYAQDWTNALYNLLFCDRPQDMMACPGVGAVDWQLALCGTQPDLQAAARIAADHEAEARVRLLACHLLRAHGVPVQARELLGVVVEVPVDDGLDTLAAYVDGSVRYLNHGGGVEMVEPGPATLPIVQRLAEASAMVVARIGPWCQARLPAPSHERVRLSFLVTDGLYFGEGEMRTMLRDGLAGPVLEHATTLMQTVVGLSHRQAA